MPNNRTLRAAVLALLFFAAAPRHVWAQSDVNSQSSVQAGGGSTPPGAEECPPSNDTVVCENDDFTGGAPSTGNFGMGTIGTLGWTVTAFHAVSSGGFDNATDQSVTLPDNSGINPVDGTVNAVGVYAIAGGAGPLWSGVAEATVEAAGTGYAPGDTCTIDGGGNNATITIDTVDGGGGVLTFHITATGTSYVTYISSGTFSTLTCTGGGSNATLRITSILAATAEGLMYRPSNQPAGTPYGFGRQFRPHLAPWVATFRYVPGRNIGDTLTNTAYIVGISNSPPIGLPAPSDGMFPGDYAGAYVYINDYFGSPLSSVAVGSSGGTGYAVNDVLTLPQHATNQGGDGNPNASFGTGGTVTVTSIGGGGAITGVSLTTAGDNYPTTNATGIPATGGGGTGALIRTFADLTYFRIFTDDLWGSLTTDVAGDRATTGAQWIKVQLEQTADDITNNKIRFRFYDAVGAQIGSELVKDWTEDPDDLYSLYFIAVTQCPVGSTIPITGRAGLMDLIRFKQSGLTR